MPSKVFITRVSIELIDRSSILIYISHTFRSNKLRDLDIDISFQDIITALGQFKELRIDTLE